MQHADDPVTPSPSVDDARPDGAVSKAALNPSEKPAVPNGAATETEAPKPGETTPQVLRQRVRSGPNFVRFALTGIVLGFAVGGFLALRGADPSNYDHSAGIGYLSLLGACLGAIIACLIAVLIDLRSAPRARRSKPSR